MMTEWSVKREGRKSTEVATDTEKDKEREEYGDRGKRIMAFHNSDYRGRQKRVTRWNTKIKRRKYYGMRRRKTGKPGEGKKEVREGGIKKTGVGDRLECKGSREESRGKRKI